MKRRIYRSHNHHLIAGLSKSPDRNRQWSNNPGAGRQPFFLYLPTIPLFHPITKSILTIIRTERITENPLFTTFTCCLLHLRGNPEIHIGHPHRQQIRTPENILQTVVFHTIGVPTVNHLIKIIPIHKSCWVTELLSCWAAELLSYWVALGSSNRYS